VNIQSIFLDFKTSVNDNPHMRIGFTGTRFGMTQIQKDAIKAILSEMRPESVHHGDCVGADYEFDRIARKLNLAVRIHPPLNNELRAYCSYSAIENYTPEEYHSRNRAIVDATNMLIAAPLEPKEILRSGTWMTIRYARKREHPCVIVFISGKVEIEK
jgi:hypothetical protein